MRKKESFRIDKRPQDIQQDLYFYRKVNAYTHKPSPEQVITLFLFLGIVVLHSVFVTSSIGHQQSAILWVLLGISYAFLVLAILDYFYLTCTDPVDRLLLYKDYKLKAHQLVRNCEQCKHLVHQSSYHCHTCHRCVEDFDHHCKFLNNCIGGINYCNFIRLLISASFYCALNIGQAIWVFILAVQDDEYNNEIISRWGTLVCMIATFLILIPVASLLFFHFYIVCCLETSTIQYLWQRRSKEKNHIKKDMNVFNCHQSDVKIQQQVNQ